MGLLDELFYPFDDRDGRELLDNLAKLYEPKEPSHWPGSPGYRREIDFEAPPMTPGKIY